MLGNDGNSNKDDIFLRAKVRFHGQDKLKLEPRLAGIGAGYSVTQKLFFFFF